MLVDRGFGGAFVTHVLGSGHACGSRAWARLPPMGPAPVNKARQEPNALLPSPTLPVQELSIIESMVRLEGARDGGSSDHISSGG